MNEELIDRVMMEWSSRTVEAVIALFVIVVAFVVYRLIKRGFDILAEKADLKRLEFRPVENTVRYLLCIAAIITILSIFKFPIEGLWTALSAVIAMVAIGFVAVWSVLSNLLCTFIILIFRPFAIGDIVEFPGDPVKGKVVDLTLIYTTLKADDGGVFQVPNNTFLQRTIKRKPSESHVSLGQQLLNLNAIE